MRSRGIRSLLLAATLSATGAGREASADVWVETVDWIPTSTVVGAPAYVAPTSYAVPTVYATESVAWSPTSYAVPSSYIVPTYYETRFRRSLFGRRLIPTGRTYYATSYFPSTLYYPSAYVLPTTYATTYSTTSRVVDSGVIATAYVPSSTCCGDAVYAPTSVRAVAPERPARVVAEPARRPSSARDEADLDESRSVPSTVEPAAPPRAQRPAPVESTPAPVAPRTDSTPPNPQTPAREQSTVRPADPAPAPAGATPRADDAPPPSAPADDEELLPAPDTGLGFNTSRQAMRPVYDPARAVDAETRNVLFGRVRERASSEPEEGVRVLLSSRTGAFDDRATMTNAFGRFAVRVPDGDWTVKVAMPSGRVYAVSEITVSNGVITDSEGRDVPSLTITR